MKPKGKFITSIVGKLWNSPCDPPCDCKKMTVDPNGAYVCILTLKQ